MNETQIYGLHGEGHILCPNCASRIYGASLEKYVHAGDLLTFAASDREPFASSGLLCDECLSWIFKPDTVDMPWWREEPEGEEHLRLLAPFTSFLEGLRVDVSNLREAGAVHSC